MAVFHLHTDIAAPRGALVLDPAAHDRIDRPCELGEAMPGSAVKPPPANLTADLVQGVLADRGQETGEVLPRLVACLAGAKGEPEKGERRVLIRAAPVSILA